MMKQGRITGLRAIAGAHHFPLALAPCRVVAAPENKPPFAVDGIVMEEDTFLVMSAPAEPRPVREPLMRIMTRVIETRPKEPGTVLIQGARPTRILAVIHDLNQEPTWREEWISRALQRVLKSAEQERLGSIALPMLGTVHGTLEEEKFMALLGPALKTTNPEHLKRIWLVIPSEMGLETLQMLKKALESGFAG